MPKPYSLSLYNQPTAATQRFVRPLTQAAKGWKRSWRSMGGCWQGSFRLDGTQRELLEMFFDYLGCEVREKTGGLLSWAGIIYEMDLTIGGVTRKRSLDLLGNDIKTTYLTQAYTGENFVENHSFENYDLAGPPNDDFYGWYEANGTSGSVLFAGAAKDGAACVALTGDTDAPDANGMGLTYIRQNLQVTPGAKYRLKFWHKGDNGGSPNDQNCLVYGLKNPNAPTNWVLGPYCTFYVGSTWLEWTHGNVIGPSEGEMMLVFYAPHNGDDGRIAYVDDVELLEEAPCVYETEWAETAESVTRYGLKEEIIHLDNYPVATSEAYRDTYLAEHGWPWARPVSAAKPGEATLDVLVCGYIFTTNWLYVQMGDGTEHDLDDWIYAIVGTDYGRAYRHGGTDLGAGDCQFVKTAEMMIGQNTLQIPQITGIEERPWDVIQELTALGDASGNPWRAWVGPARWFHYHQIDTTPRYFLRKDGIYDTMAGTSPANPWLMQPAVVRDLGWTHGLIEPGSFLTDPRDLYCDQVTMADGWDRPELSTVSFSEADLLQARSERK